MPRPHGNCKFQNEWLAIDKFKGLVVRDGVDDKVAKMYVTMCMKTVRIANAGKHALESHVSATQHQRCERAASSSVVNVLAPQSRVAVPVMTVSIPSTSSSGDSSCETEFSVVIPGSRHGCVMPAVVWRNTKTAMMKNKRKLHDANRKGIYINDDLTPLRTRMARILRHDPSTQSGWSIDGRIFGTMLENGREVKKIVESPDDLFKLGWSEEKVKNLNIYF